MPTSSNLIKLNNKVVLASASPRRKQLLSLIINEFDICPSGYDESEITIRNPNDYVTKLAYQKAHYVAKNQFDNSVVIGADTCVVLDNEILNKPESKEHAFEMLKKLSGNTHQVFTGLSLIHLSENKIFNSFKKTDVTFRNLTDNEIKEYIKTGSPMDKAGAYGIQDDFGAVFVSKINGCYYNIVGLPLELLYKELKNFN